jgi:hypothetical protein
MLPKGPLGYAMIKKLKVYAGAEHPHTAQQPQESGDLIDRIDMIGNYNYGTGRRKSSVARVFLKPGHRQDRRQRQAAWTSTSPAKPAAWSCASR